MSLHDLPDCNLRTDLSVTDLAQQGNCDVRDCIGLFLGNLGQQGNCDSEDWNGLTLATWLSKEIVTVRTGQLVPW